MKFDTLIDIKTTIDGNKKYYYYNLEFDTYAEAEAYIESLETNEVPKEPTQEEELALIASTYNKAEHGELKDLLKRKKEQNTNESEILK